MCIFFCVLIIGGIFTGDYKIKKYVEEKVNEPRPILGGRILLRKYHNRGAMLNLGQRRSKIVTAVSLFLCLLLTAVFLLSLGRRGNNLLRIGLSFLLGGAFSNTYDRLKRKYVVDYFSFRVKWKPLGRIVYNLSDFCIITGALLVVLGSP